MYNADGTVNKCGKITEYVEARMTVGEHAERVHFGVVQLGNADIFLGHDWLAHHNPSINWADGTLNFDRCPGQCGFTEEDLERMQPKDEAQKWLSSIVDEEPWWEARKAKQYSEQQNCFNVCSVRIHEVISPRILIRNARPKFHRKAMHLAFPWMCSSRDHDQYLPRYARRIGETAL